MEKERVKCAWGSLERMEKVLGDIRADADACLNRYVEENKVSNERRYELEAIYKFYKWIKLPTKIKRLENKLKLKDRYGTRR